MWSGNDVSEDQEYEPDDHAYDYDDRAPDEEYELSDDGYSGDDAHSETVPADDVTNDSHIGYDTSSTLPHDTQYDDSEIDGDHRPYQDVVSDSEIPEGSTPCDPDGYPLFPYMQNGPDDEDSPGSSDDGEGEEHLDGNNADIANSDADDRKETDHLGEDIYGLDERGEDELHEEEDGAPEQAPTNDDGWRIRQQQIRQQMELEQREWKRERFPLAPHIPRIIDGSDDGRSHGAVYSETLGRYVPRDDDDVPQELDGDVGDVLVNIASAQATPPQGEAAAPTGTGTVNFFGAAPVSTGAPAPTDSTVNFFGPTGGIAPAPATALAPTDDTVDFFCPMKATPAQTAAPTLALVPSAPIPKFF